MTDFPELTVGTARYYTAVMSNESLQARVYSSLALTQTLEKMLIKVSDPGVARLKIQWWKDEIAKASKEQNTQVQHPLIAHLTHFSEHDIKLYHNYLDALESMITEKLTLQNSQQIAQFAAILSTPETTIFVDNEDTGCQQFTESMGISLALGRMALTDNPKLQQLFFSHGLNKQQYIALSQDYYANAFISIHTTVTTQTLFPAYQLASCQQKLNQKVIKKWIKTPETIASLSPLHYYWLSRQAHRALSKGKLRPLVN